MTLARMPLLPDDWTLIRRYLLGGLDDAAMARVEERVIDDEAFSDAIELTQDELVEEYVRGTGPAQERQALARFVDSPDRQRRVALTRELTRRFGTPAVASPVKERPAAPGSARAAARARRSSGWGGQWMGLAAAASVLMSLGSAVYLGLQAGSLRGELAAMQAREREQIARIDALTVPRRVATQSFLIEPAQAVRSAGGAEPVLSIADRSGDIALQLPLSGGAASTTYSVVVRRVGNQQAQIWGESGLTADAGRLVATMRGALMTADDYVATVSSADGTVTATYRFRVGS